MELFELAGKIAVLGADKAKKDIDGVTSFAEKRALKLYDAINKISGSAAVFQPDRIYPDTGVREYTGDTRDSKKTVRSSVSMEEINSNLTARKRPEPVLSEIKLPEYDIDFSEPFEQALKSAEFLCEKSDSAFDSMALNGKLSSVFSDIAEKIGMVNRACDKSPASAKTAAAAFEAVSESAGKFSGIYGKNSAAAAKAAEAAENTSKKAAGVGRVYDMGFAAAEDAAEKASGIARKFAGAAGAYEESGRSAKNAAGDISGIAEKIMGIGNAFGDSERMTENAADAFSGYCAKVKNLGGISESVYSGSEKIGEIISKITEGYIAAEDSGSQSLQRQRKNVFDEMELMGETVSVGMAGILSGQLEFLGRLRYKTRSEWDRIGSAGYDGISKMAAGVNSAAPLVTAACSQVAGSSLSSLSIDGSPAGAYLMDTFRNGLAAKAASVYSTVASIASEISGIMSGITLSVSGIGNISPLPGHAEGGIVTREHIARVGEDGAEAIIPLEKNTEWMDRVAERINGGTGNSAVLDKLTELNENIRNLRIYLDGKTLVGEIAPAMDGALGSIARRKRRSMI